MYRQLVAPNLATVSPIGSCLWFAETAFNTPHNTANRVNDCATDEWNAAQFRYLDRDFPTGVYVPIWFSYWATLNRIYKDWGHVAILMPDGRVLSSPYKQDNSQQIFNSVDDCARVLRCTYLGWSEDLAGIKLIESNPEGNVWIEEPVLKDLETWKANGLELTQDRDNVLYPQIERLKSENAEMLANLVKANQRIDALQATTSTAIQSAQKAAPSATKASWFTKLLAALTSKK